jgi:antitoxin ParD1/3/4
LEQTLKIELTPSQAAILQAAVAAGEFPTIEAALQQALDQILPLDTDDLSWARPYVDKARESIAQGRYVTLDEFRRDIREAIARLHTE